MSELGEPPMPWQRDALAVEYELDEDATERASSEAGEYQPRLWYRENRLTVPRQSGKTTKAKARHIHRMRKSRAYGWSARPLSFYMAQTATDAREKLVEEWMEALRESPFWIPDDDERATPESPIQQFIRSNGREAIKWLGGGRITVKPPSRTGGHGGSPDLIDLDEAFAHRDATAEQGVRPGMITKVSAQEYVVSTAGTAESEFLWGKVDDGRSRCQTLDPLSRVSYIEYSAYPGECNSAITDLARDIDMSDHAVLWACSPALGHTIELVNLLADIDSMDPDEGRRAYGNIWTSSVKRIIPADAWALTLDPLSQIVGDMWLAVDASPGVGSQRSASIAVGGWNEAGKPHVEIIDSAPGLSWVADRVGALTSRWTHIQRAYLDPTGPIGSIVPDIEKTSAVGVERISSQEMSAACGRLLEDIIDGNHAHIGQDVLDGAVDGAAKRTLLDAWAWARRTSASNIAPLVAVTLVHWATVTHPRNDSRIV